MNTLRAAAQQALEAFEAFDSPISIPAMDALRAALADGDNAAPTEQPQRKPLTEEEIRDLWSWSMTAEAERTATTQQHAFARAIERAHNITGESK